MIEIKNMLLEYRESIARVYGRIQELHVQIEEKGGEGAVGTKPFAERRYRLYQQLWDMQQAVSSLEEYIEQVSKRREGI